MRFRAKLSDLVCITRLSNVVSSLAKNIKTCVLRLSVDKVCFVLAAQGSLGMNIWCELTQENFFDEYRIETREEANEIYLELNMEPLARGLKSAHSAQMLKIKLSKKQGAYLTLDIAQPTYSGAVRNVVHDIPVTVVPTRLWSDYQEPNMPDINVSVYLPPLKQLKTIVDKMKSMCSRVTVAANSCGELQLRIETDIVTATTYFRDLQNHIFDSQMSQNASTFYETTVDVKKLSQFLGGQFNPSKVICNIVDGRGLQLFFLHEDVSIQYYIPGLA